MSNNLKKIEKDLRAFAKRCKDVKYTQALLYVFLMTGAVSFTATTAESIEGARKEIKTSITDMKKLFKDAKRENNKLMKQSNLELIQLMEQGDHVVKSPWSSWQYGENYYYNGWNGTYKGKGDKKQKYLYEGILERDSNLMNRYIPRESSNYASLTTLSGNNPASASSNERGIFTYGLVDTQPVPEPPLRIEFDVTINPKVINKAALNLTPPVAAAPPAINPVRFAPISPDIAPPADPDLPLPPNFAIVLGADCNVGCGASGSSGPKQGQRVGFTLDPTTQANHNIQSMLHYTWSGSGAPGIRALGFKMYADTSGDFTLGTTVPSVESGAWASSSAAGNVGNEYYFNSYNFGNGVEFATVSNSLPFSPIEKNHQYFFVGGSRFIESDNAYSPNTIKIPSGYTLNLGGILTLGLVSQGWTTTQVNQGVITDAKEKDDAWISNINSKYDYNVTFNPDGSVDTATAVTPGTGTHLKIDGPTETYYIKKSTDGYVGYKVAIALVEEDAVSGGQILNDTGGVIDFRGERSIGLYTYLPNYTSDRPMINKGKIYLSGRESYGIKLGATTIAAGIDILNDNNAEINLRKNPAPGGTDTADNSVGIALMEDATVANNVNLASGKAKNKGNINITDVKNSVGTFINIDSDITNEGKIAINSVIATAGTGEKQAYNIGMRSDKGTGKGGSTNVASNAKVINANTTGKITLKGKYAIGMLSDGANAENHGDILTDTSSSGNIINGIGMYGADGAAVKNSGKIELDGTTADDASNIGIFANSGSQVELLAANPPAVATTSDITVKGNNSTGLLVTGKKGTASSKITLNGKVQAYGNGVIGAVANGAEITEASSNVASGSTIKVRAYNGTDAAGESGTGDNKKGSYGVVVKNTVSGGNAERGKFTSKDVLIDVKVKGAKSIGMYSEGDLKAKKVNIETEDQAINFFANKHSGSGMTIGEIEIGETGYATPNTAKTGKKSLLFYSENGGKIKLLSPLNATIEGATGTDASLNRGTAFYFKGNNYSDFNFANVQTWAKDTFGDGTTSTLNQLNLTMNTGSRLFVASDVKMNLTDTNPDPTSPTSVVNALGLSGITGTDYKTFMLYLSKLKINTAVNLNDANGLFAQLEIANSSIDNADVITGSQADQIGLAQENGEDSSGVAYDSDKVQLTNTADGSITMTGDRSTAMYAKRGQLLNKGLIDMGKSSTALYVIEDNTSRAAATLGATARNENMIKLGESSTAIYYKAETTGNNKSIAGGATNAGTIEGNANKVIAMTAVIPAGVTNKYFKNEQGGVIDLKADESTAMFTDGDGTYTAENAGTIKMADSANPNIPNIAMYAGRDTHALNSDGIITGGKHTVALYGHNMNLGATSDTKIGDKGVIAYSKGGNVTLHSGAKAEVGKDEAAVVYYTGNGGTVTNNASDVKIGDSSYGFIINPSGTGGNTFVSNTPLVNVGNDVVYYYSTDANGTAVNNTSLKSTGNENYGLYTSGTAVNNGTIDFSQGVGNIGAYATGNTGKITNAGMITVGKSEPENKKYSVAMAGGYSWSKQDELLPVASRPTQYIGEVENAAGGVINVTGENSIAMFATYNNGGQRSRAVNRGTINLSGTGAIGMFIDAGGIGENYGTIQTVGSPTGVVGVVVRDGGEFINHPSGRIHINSPGGYALFSMEKAGKRAVVLKNYGTVTISGGAKEKGRSISADDIATAKVIDDNYGEGSLVLDPKSANPITIDGVAVPYRELNSTKGVRYAMISNFGLYVDTLIGTNPIDNLGAIGVHEADLLIGVDAAKEHNDKAFLVKQSILEPYRKAMAKNKSLKWNINSASLTWAATAKLDDDKLPIEIIMAKKPYTYFASDKKTTRNTYNFADGLEQRYGVEAIDSREKALFNKLNDIGGNEENLLYQAFDEMMGHQYANVQQRTYGTGRMIDKEISHLSKEWDTKSRQSNKIKMFGMRDEYNTDTAGIIDYKSNAYGFAYLHEDETVKLGNSSGWYAGAVHNRFKFKDIGGSKENQTMLKLGVFKTMSPAKDHNGSLQWTISGEGYVSRNHMHRKYLVVDEIFNAKSDYTTYGVALNNQLGYNIRTSERTSIRPYGGLKLEYGRFSNIKEKSGEMRLDIKGNDYYSIKPEVGVEFKYRQPMAVRTTFVTSLGLGYENELGQVGNVKNKAKVSYTEADWFNIRGEKDDRKGNFKADLNIGVENQRFGVTLNGGYDTKGKNVRGGLGFRIIY